MAKMQYNHTRPVASFILNHEEKVIGSTAVWGASVNKPAHLQADFLTVYCVYRKTLWIGGKPR